MSKEIKNILICGDSFAAIWPGDYGGWPIMLSNDYTVTNCAQAGVGEYKVSLQLASKNIRDYDLIIVCHTSAFRVHVEQHPYYKDGLHKNADLIYTDVVSQNHKGVTDHLKYYFEKVFDLNYALDIHNMIKERITSRTTGVPCLHLNFFATLPREFINEGEINLHDVWQQNPGAVNHMSQTGNQLVYQILKEKICEVTHNDVG